MSDIEKTTPGQTKKSPEECRDAFEAFTSALELTNLRMSTDSKGRYTISKDIDGVQTKHVAGPLAGNSFVRLLSGAEKLISNCRAA